MAKTCPACRMPKAPVDECICVDDEQEPEIERPAEFTPRFQAPPEDAA